MAHTTSSLWLCCHILNDKLLAANFMQALPVSADRVADLPGKIGKMWNALDDPDALEALAHELDKAVTELQEKAQAHSDIDLSDPERAEIYREVQTRFLRTLVMQAEMPLSMLNSLIWEHTAFVGEFNKIKGKDLTLRAQRLKALVGLTGK